MADDGTVTITVAQRDSADGEFGEAAEVDPDTPFTFKNIYEGEKPPVTPTSVSLSGTVKAEGAPMLSGQFAYGLYKANEAGTTSEPIVEAKTNSESGTTSPLNFSEISFDTAGTYYYVMQPKSESGDGWTVDGTKYLVTITVEAGEDGALTATVTYQKINADGTLGDPSETTPIWTNVYEEPPVTHNGTWSPDATVNTENGEMKSNEFTFAIYESDEDGKQGDLVQSSENDQSGVSSTIPFDKITKDPGDYYYLVKQTTTASDGVTLDTSEYLVHVHVADDGTVDVTITKDSEPANSIVFTNIYPEEKHVTPTSAALSGTVKGQGGSMTAGQFAYGLYAADANGTINGAALQTPRNAEGTTSPLDFGQVSFNKAGTYYYVMQPESTSKDGWTVDGTKYLVTITVTEGEDGTLSATVTYQKINADGSLGESSSTPPTWINIYSQTPPPVIINGTWKPSATVNTKGGSMGANDFEFTIYESDPSGTQGSKIQSSKNAQGGITSSIPFDEITKEPGDYYYLVKQTTTASDGVTLDTTEYLVHVNVADDGTVTVTITRKGPGEAEFTTEVDSMVFTNVYSQTPPVQPPSVVTTKTVTTTPKTTVKIIGLPLTGDTLGAWQTMAALAVIASIGFAAVARRRGHKSQA